MAEQKFRLLMSRIRSKNNHGYHYYYPCILREKFNLISALFVFVIGIFVNCHFYGQEGTTTGNKVYGFVWPTEFFRNSRSNFKKYRLISIAGPIPGNLRSYAGAMGNCSTDEDSDGSLIPKPYRNRSLSWTQRYRSVLPYETARTWVMELGLRSKAEWDEYVEDGKVFHRSYLPNHPDEMYADEWVSWDEFLGLMRSYNDTRNIVQNVLHIHTMDEYNQFITMNPKRAEGLRIPAKPWIVYREQWIGDEDFFGTWK